MLSSEDIFIKDLEDFLVFDLKFNDKIKNKIRKLLSEYSNKVSVQEKIVTQNFFVYKSNFGLKSSPHSTKKILVLDDIKPEFEKYCQENNIKYQTRKKKGRSEKAVTKIRAEFCNYIAENYLVSKSDLAIFFGLNHATIHYYFNPKK